MAERLPTTILGRTGLEVTQLGYGASEIRGTLRLGRPITEEQADTILNSVLDSSINFIDTANGYGRSEEFIGKYISHRRSEYLIATKCGCIDSVGEAEHLWTRENLFRGLHESLQRMRTDYVDLMQFHGPTVEECECEDLVEALQKMRQQGKVRWIGTSSTLPELATYLDWGVFDAFQIPYSALERKHEDWITAVAEAGAGTIVRGGVARGEPGLGGIDRPEVWRKYDEANLDDLLGEGESRTGFVLRYTLTHPHVHTIIVGTLQPEHLQENVKATLRGPLPMDTYAEVSRRMEALGVTAQPVS